MRKNVVNIDNELINDLKAYGANFGIGLATYVRDELTESTKNIIELFYDSYRPYKGEPYKYRRHYYNFRDNSYEKYYSNPHNQIIRGGVRLTPFEMDDIYNKNTGEEVFHSVIMRGERGPQTKRNTAPSMIPTPYDLIIEKRAQIIRNIGSLLNQGFERASKGKYTYL